MKRNVDHLTAGAARNAAVLRPGGLRAKRGHRRIHGAVAGIDPPGRDRKGAAWRQGLPALLGEGLDLREPAVADATQLAALAARDDVWRFTLPEPRSADGWARFIQRLRADRSAGVSVCYAVTGEQTSAVVGLILVRRLELTFRIAECQFLFGDAAWRSGLPTASLAYVLDFAFRDVGVHRVECRSPANCENAHLRRLGFVNEGLLRGACRVKQGFADQSIWSMLRADWQSNAKPPPRRRPPDPCPDEPVPAAVDLEDRDPQPSWSIALPVLRGPRVTLSEIESSDGEFLARVLEPADIEMCIEPAPTTAAMFRDYIAWARRQRAEGRVACFSIFVDGRAGPVGLLQVRSQGPGFTVAEWGIGLMRAIRGAGISREAMSLIVPFVFDTLGAHRLEARTSLDNAPAIALVRRLGAVREARLRESFLQGGQYRDDELWAVTENDWRRNRMAERRDDA